MAASSSVSLKEDYAYSNIEGNSLAPKSSAIKLLTRSDWLILIIVLLTSILFACSITAACFVIFYDQPANESQTFTSSQLIHTPLSCIQDEQSNKSQSKDEPIIQSNNQPIIQLINGPAFGSSVDDDDCSSDFTEASAYVQQNYDKEQPTDAVARFHAIKLPQCWTRDRYQAWLSGTLPTRRNHTCHTCKSKIGLSINDFMVNVITGVVHHRDRADIIACTWMQEFSPNQFFFHTDDDDDEERLPVFRAINETGNWDTSQNKWIPGLLYTMAKAHEIEKNEKRTIKWHVVADDDTIMFPNNLIRLASQYDHNEPIIIASINPGYSNGVPYGGAGWIYSRAAAEIMESMLHKCNRYKGHTQSDVFIGVCLQELTKIKMVDRREFGSQPAMYYLNLDWERHQTGFYRAVSFHYIKDWHDYYYIYQLYKAFSFNIYD